LVVTACGGNDSESSGVASLETEAPTVASSQPVGTSSPTTTAGPVDDETAMLAFTACMREEGIDVEDPTVDADGNLEMERMRDIVGGNDADHDVIEAARLVCDPHLEGVTIQTRRADDTDHQDTLVAYALCMREEGFDIDDPVFGQGGGTGPFGEIDTDDPTYAPAHEVCEPVLGGFVPGGGGGKGDE
jgi:hypothetical protein